MATIATMKRTTRSRLVCAAVLRAAATAFS
jgi:hypothetical protein